MMRQRLISAVVAAIVLPLGLGGIAGSTAKADVHVGVGLGVGIPLGHHSSLGLWFGGPVYHGGYHYYGHPYQYGYIAPPPVVYYPAPRVVAPPAPVVVAPESVPVTVWVANSNGSKTAVKLIQHGDSYEGPRGEWYSGMPTNEQLRMAYGF